MPEISDLDREPVVVVADALSPDCLADLGRLVGELVQTGVRTIVIDISEVRTMTSTTVTALLTAQRSCQAGGAEVMLRGPSRRVADRLGRTGLLRLIPIEEGGRKE